MSMAELNRYGRLNGPQSVKYLLSGPYRKSLPTSTLNQWWKLNKTKQPCSVSQGREKELETQEESMSHLWIQENQGAIFPVQLPIEETFTERLQCAKLHFLPTRCTHWPSYKIVFCFPKRVESYGKLHNDFPARASDTVEKGRRRGGLKGWCWERSGC